MSEKVSVLITSYNYGRFLRQCLQSVISQSRPPDEIILVDDGSTDDTPLVAAAFPQVRYVWQKNGGYAAASNLAFKESTGDILCHLDADDYWMPDKLESVLEVLERFPRVTGVIHDTIAEDAQGEEIRTSQPTIKCEAEIFTLYNTTGGGFLYPVPQLKGYLHGNPTTITVRRRAIADLFPIPEGPPFAVDGVLLVGAFREGVYHLPEVLGVYRRHGSNLWAGNPASEVQIIRMWRYLLGHPAIRSLISLRHADLWEAAVQERIAYVTSRTGDDKVAGTLAALRVPLLLMRHGVVCNWKHLALPLMCWLPIRRDRRKISGHTGAP